VLAHLQPNLDSPCDLTVEPEHNGVERPGTGPPLPAAVVRRRSGALWVRIGPHPAPAVQLTCGEPGAQEPQRQPTVAPVAAAPGIGVWIVLVIISVAVVVRVPSIWDAVVVVIRIVSVGGPVAVVVKKSFPVCDASPRRRGSARCLGRSRGKSLPVC